MSGTTSSMSGASPVKRKQSGQARAALKRINWKRAVDSDAKGAEAFRLRIDGWSVTDIATKLGYADPSGASRAITRHVESLPKVNADEDRAKWAERLDLAAKGLMPKAKKGDSKAVDSLVKVVDRDAKLKGLDAKQEIELTLRERQLENLTPAALLQKIREQRAKLDEHEVQLLEEHPELRRVEPSGAPAIAVKATHDPPSMSITYMRSLDDKLVSSERPVGPQGACGAINVGGFTVVGTKRDDEEEGGE